MKTQSLLIALALLLGIGIGWLIKPSAEPEEASTGPVRSDQAELSSRPASDADGDGEKPVRRKKTTTVVIGGSDEDATPEEREMQAQISNAMTDRQKKMDDRRIADLVEKLGLDAAQEESLREFYAGRREMIAGMFSGETNAVPDMSQFAESRLDELMGEVLSDDQQETYDEVKTAEREKKVESRALKDLASINSVIDIREDQKDAVYEVLYDDAGAKVDKAAESGAAIFSSVLGGGFGADVDTAGMHDIAYEVGSDTAGDPAVSPAEAFRKAQQKRIDGKVNRLSGVLDEDQLAGYREHLESQSKMFESFMPSTPAE